MKNKQIVNVFSFARRYTTPDFSGDYNNIERFCCTEQQLDLYKSYDIPFTYLLDYDAVMDPRFKAKLDECPKAEVGVWFECAKPMVTAVGAQWRGRDRYIWDYKPLCAYPIAYPMEKRLAMADLLMEGFKSVFGDYPKVVGAWILDAVTLNYLYEKYHIEAACMCRDQWGTDGISLWGGYFNQGFYPSKYNTLCPASTKENQIDLPMFRMLGSCPTYQYDMGLKIDDGPSELQGVVTLESVYTDPEIGGGGVPEWVDWYLRENFRPDTLSYNYTHIGQENTFGWNKQEAGTRDQLNKTVQMAKEGKIVFQTLLETAREFKSCYDLTPATSITAMDDWKGTGTQSLWYNCRNYRANCFRENGIFWLRDITLFRETYTERYREQPLDCDHLVFDNLPVIDGNRWSGNGIRAGLYPVWADGAPVQGETKVTYGADETTETVTVTDGADTLTLTFTETDITVTGTKAFGLELKKVDERANPCVIEGNALRYTQRGYDYRLVVDQGTVGKQSGTITLASAGGTVKLLCDQ